MKTLDPHVRTRQSLQTTRARRAGEARSHERRMLALEQRRSYPTQRGTVYPGLFSGPVQPLPWIFTPESPSPLGSRRIFPQKPRPAVAVETAPRSQMAAAKKPGLLARMAAMFSLRRLAQRGV